MAFTLDPRLENDTVSIGQLSLCDVRLMGDARWPWLILVPMVADASEWHDLDSSQQAIASNEIALASKALKSVTSCEKINVGALGNIVRQLHLHVIARNEGDTNWPGPVWGIGNAVPFEHEERERLIAAISKHLF